MTEDLVDSRPKEVESETSSDDAGPPTADEFFKSPDFYKNAQQYWSRIDPTIDGMLGGLSIIDTTDVNGSARFLNQLFKMKPAPGTTRALDCGAGIGRVTKNLLMNYFKTVDLVEQDENFVRKAHDYLSTNDQLNEKIGTIHNVGLQDFTLTDNTYDVIWCQWVLGHLTDEDLGAFFKRCTAGLTKNGCIIIKENFTSTNDFCIDATDSSVTRSLRVTKTILESANLRIVKICKQDNFIQGLFPVYSIACKPNRRIQ
ncbi:alpha N-terminal protein methyltransferase 1 [Sitodiplosis mosellana]|uniref:alpha N-terminal protein methyltransferase 1 n=1 Tax=Sitodiplosis mosellana TaxID=263140 RepID=UPI002443B06F|nr:alpha N-terminal protein methyltransferase 1 [Sitodiplosis mosellana]